MRQRFQNGSLRLKHRTEGGKVWELRYYDRGKRKYATVGTLAEFPSKSAMRKSARVQALLLGANAESPLLAGDVTMEVLISRYEQQEMPQRYSTQSSYQSYLDNHIKPRWNDVKLSGVKAMAVESWINALELAPKTKGNIRGLMHVILDCAIRWELTDKNPMDLVRVKGGAQRQQRPTVLTTEQFTSLLAEIREPYRTMVLVAGCLGLRVCEIVGLQWSDFDYENGTLLVQRGVVHGRVGEVKTESSRDLVPIDPLLAEALLRHRAQCYPTAEGWLFANPKTSRPYHQEEIQKRHIVNAAAGAGITERVGWHTFRHSYRSWLDSGGASIGVQKELMQHASIQTTMNVYGRGAMTDPKRTANSNVVEMVFRDPQPAVQQPMQQQAVASA